MIKFYLNGKPHQVDNLDPNLSILNWLRTDRRLMGTKEGCASGDCGACTVVLGRVTAGGGLRYTAINSCIALMGSVHGAHLITVDALQHRPAHPVQQTMMDLHGSQCGFCTPGFIMSLFALHQNQRGQPTDDENLHETLSGNLCRCTGYRPIVDAGRAAMVHIWAPESNAVAPQHPATVLQDPGIVPTLIQINTEPAALHDDAGRWYQAPNSLAELRALTQRWPEAQLIAGGTDLALDITQQLNTLPHLISVQRVPELLAVAVDAEQIELGAAVSYEDLRGPLTAAWPAFDPMLTRLGSRQLRHCGTLGGNIGNASPIADMPPPLLALDATLILDGPNGARELPVREFFLDYKRTALAPSEFIRAVRLPTPKANERLFIYKVSKRLDDDISAVLGAFWLTLVDGVVLHCRLAWGGMAATPARSLRAEAALTGAPWNATSVAAAVAALAQDFTPLSDIRASADYRTQVAGNLLKRALLATDPASPSLTVTDYA